MTVPLSLLLLVLGVITSTVIILSDRAAGLRYAGVFVVMSIVFGMVTISRLTPAEQAALTNAIGRWIAVETASRPDFRSIAVRCARVVRSLSADEPVPPLESRKRTDIADGDEWMIRWAGDGTTVDSYICAGDRAGIRVVRIEPVSTSAIRRN